ncbi:MAG TPA: hypothetical protein VEQ11_03635 [Chloroflexota bacterium]|nr:hypothetical protein [Chloroflexota bacterium]
MTRFSLTYLVAALLVSASLIPLRALAQAQEGATMTVLRGEVAVVRGDGSALQPAPSGTVVRPGDEIRTLGPSGALITFFVGTEIEMGEATVLVVERVSKQGERIDVSLKQVFGATLNRVQSFTDPGSAYRIDVGGAVAVVRGTEFLTYGPTPEGIAIIVCLSSCTSATTFAGCAMAPDLGIWVQVDRGRVLSRCETFAPHGGPWNAATEAYTTALQQLQADSTGTNAGLTPGGQTGAKVKEREEHHDTEQPIPVPVVLPAASPLPLGPVQPTPACTNPAISESGAPGTASIAVTQRNQGGGSFLYAMFVTISGGPPNKSLEAYIFFSGSLISLGHQFVGSFTTDSSGNATFSGTIVRPGPLSTADAETNTPGTTASPGPPIGDHVFIARSISPCTVL